MRLLWLRGAGPRTETGAGRRWEHVPVVKGRVSRRAKSHLHPRHLGGIAGCRPKIHQIRLAGLDGEGCTAPLHAVAIRCIVRHRHAFAPVRPKASQLQKNPLLNTQFVG